MIRGAMMAAVAVGGLLTVLAVTPTAEALPMAKAQGAAGSVVTPVGKGGPGGHGHGFGGMGRGIGHGIGRGHGFGGGGMKFYGGGGGHHHHHRGPRFHGFYAAPFVGYGGYYYGYRDYGSGCGWLKRRALATGSRYWWRRYQDCLDDYD